VNIYLQVNKYRNETRGNYCVAHTYMLVVGHNS